MPSVTQLRPFDPFATIIDLRDAQESPRTIRYGFRSGSYNLLLAHAVMSEAVADPRVYPLPRSPQRVLGMAGLRGNLVAVFDVHGWLSGAQVQGDYLLVIGEGAYMAGILADELPTAVDVGQASIEQASGVTITGPLRNVVSDVVHVDGAMWLGIDHRALFDVLARQP